MIEEQIKCFLNQFEIKFRNENIKADPYKILADFIESKLPNLIVSENIVLKAKYGELLNRSRLPPIIISKS